MKKIISTSLILGGMLLTGCSIKEEQNNFKEEQYIHTKELQKFNVVTHNTEKNIRIKLNKQKEIPKCPTTISIYETENTEDIPYLKSVQYKETENKELKIEKEFDMITVGDKSSIEMCLDKQNVLSLKIKEETRKLKEEE